MIIFFAQVIAQPFIVKCVLAPLIQLFVVFQQPINKVCRTHCTNAHQMPSKLDKSIVVRAAGKIIIGLAFGAALCHLVESQVCSKPQLNSSFVLLLVSTLGLTSMCSQCGLFAKSFATILALIGLL